MTSRRARALRTALVALVVVIAGAELGLRRIVADTRWLDVMRFEYPPGHRGACFGLQPGARVTFEGAWTRIPPTEIVINADGLRDAPRDLTRDVPRILMLGDSQVFGLGVEADASLPRMVEARWIVRGYGPVEVINAGVPGYDLPKEVDALDPLIARYRPARVVFVLDPNDLTHVPCAWWKNRTRPLLRSSVLARAIYFAHGGGRPDDPTPAPMRRVLTEETRRIQALTAPRAIPFSLVALGPLPEVTPGVDVIDLVEVHGRLRADPDRYVIPGDGHLNAAGLAELADALTRALSTPARSVSRSPAGTMNL